MREKLVPLPTDMAPVSWDRHFVMLPEMEAICFLAALHKSSNIFLKHTHVLQTYKRMINVGYMQLRDTRLF